MGSGLAHSLCALLSILIKLLRQSISDGYDFRIDLASAEHPAHRAGMPHRKPRGDPAVAHTGPLPHRGGGEMPRLGPAEKHSPLIDLRQGTAVMAI